MDFLILFPETQCVDHQAVMRAQDISGNLTRYTRPAKINKLSAWKGEIYI